MPAEPFQIEFNYGVTPYVGIVTPIDKSNETWYSVQLESENQESNVAIIAKPSQSALEDWDFSCEEEGDPFDYYDKDLLQEIGEAIERYLIDPNKMEKLDL
jgi:hypothetical protein